ncbi:MAG: extracellular solute-binding protein [Chloroflexi bacterium OHK40]
MSTAQHIRRALLICLALLALAGCSASAGPGATPTAGPASAPAARTILVLWHAWPTPEDRALAAVVDRFNRTTPGVQVILQSKPMVRLRAELGTAVADGGGPHLAIVPSHVLGGLVEEGALLPVEGLVPTGEVARLLPAAVGAAQVQSTGGATLYGVPITFDTLAVYYNKANFPDPLPEDTDALLAAARGLTETGSEPPLWGMALNLSLDRTIGYLYAFGGRIFDETGGVALGLDGRAGAEAWLAWLLALREDERLLASMDGISVDNALQSQQALMTIDWAHAMSTYRTIWPETMGVAPLPRLTSTNRAPQPYVQSDVLVLNARLGPSAEQAAAASFARFLVGEQAQRELLRAGRQPVLLSLDLTDEDPALPETLRTAAQAFRAQAEGGLPMPNARAASEMAWPVLAEMHSNVLRRLLTPTQAVEGADATLRARLGSQ